MDRTTARELSRLTSAFYQEVAASFSATRQAPWPGWERLLDEVCPVAAPGDKPVRVLDLACGNLRFERLLATRLSAVEAYGVDNCAALADADPMPANVAVHLQDLDIMETLFAGAEFANEGLADADSASASHAGVDLALAIEAPPCDLVVCFGFFHHVPLPEQRAAVLSALVAHTRPGGHVAVAFWQFARDERLLRRARPVDAAHGDHLLGWQQREDVARYCHSFSEEEIDALAASVADKTYEVARFSADGRSGDLNRYVVLRREP